MGSGYSASHFHSLRDGQPPANGNTTTPDTANTYWANGLLKSIDNGVSKSDYTYNNRNLLTSETQKQRRPVDVLDRSEATWGAAPKGRGATLSQTLSGRPARVVSYDYDAALLLRQGNGGQDSCRHWSAQVLPLESSSLASCISFSNNANQSLWSVRALKHPKLLDWLFWSRVASFPDKLGRHGCG